MTVVVKVHGAEISPISLGVYTPLSPDVVAGGKDVADVVGDLCAVECSGLTCSADACYEVIVAPVVEGIVKSIWMLGPVVAIVGFGAMNVSSGSISVRPNLAFTAATGGCLFDPCRGLGVP